MNSMEQDLKLRLFHRLINEGWGHVVLDSHYLGWKFDIVGERRDMLERWYVLVKFVDCLDQHNVTEFENMFSEFRKDPLGRLSHRFFILCIIAGTTDPDAISYLHWNILGLFEIFRLTSIGGTTFILDLKNKKIYEKPGSFHLMSTCIQKELGESLNK